LFFFFSSRSRHTSFSRDWSSDVCSSDLDDAVARTQAFQHLDLARVLAAQPHIHALGSLAVVRDQVHPATGGVLVEAALGHHQARSEERRGREGVKSSGGQGTDKRERQSK